MLLESIHEQKMYENAEKTRENACSRTFEVKNQEKDSLKMKLTISK